MTATELINLLKAERNRIQLRVGRISPFNLQSTEEGGEYGTY